MSLVMDLIRSNVTKTKLLVIHLQQMLVEVLQLILKKKKLIIMFIEYSKKNCSKSKKQFTFAFS